MCQQVNFLSVPFPKLEESVVRDFKLLSSAFLSDLLEIFLKSSNAKQNFQHGPIKIAELGTEVSHVGALALIKGFKFEGFLLQTSGPAAAKSALAQQIRELLLQSKFCFLFLFLMFSYVYIYTNILICVLYACSELDIQRLAKKLQHLHLYPQSTLVTAPKMVRPISCVGLTV